MGFVALALALGAEPAVAADLTGHARVVDGDTLYLDHVKIRLFGIDAPETDQVCLDGHAKLWSCGLAAREALAAKIGTRQISCVSRDRDKFGRVVATCSLDGEDLNRWLVHEGLAVAYLHYSRDYESEQGRAKSAHAGLWAGAFIAPENWRHRSATTTILGSITVPLAAQKVLLGAESFKPQDGCQIKGNVSRTGERIYHVPGQRFYAQTRMDKGVGERWFCTEEEATAAGWRRSAQ